MEFKWGPVEIRLETRKLGVSTHYTVIDEGWRIHVKNESHPIPGLASFDAYYKPDSNRAPNINSAIRLVEAELTRLYGH